MAGEENTLVHRAEIPEQANGSGAVILRYGGILFFLCALLANPGIYDLTTPRNLPLFTAGALGWAAAGLLCASFLLKPEPIKVIPRIQLLAWGGLFLIFAIHIFTGKVPSRHYLHLPGEELLILCLPLLFCENFPQWKKMWIRFGVFLWGYNLLTVLYAFFRNKVLWKNGICGNENWSAALLAMGIPFLCLYFEEKIPHKKVRVFLFWTVVTGSVLLNLLIFSKGALLCTALCTALFLFFKAGKTGRRILLSGMVLLLLAGGVFVKFHAKETEEFLSREARVQLWNSALTLIAKNIFTGTSQGGFENEFMQCRSEDYFFVFNPAARSNHPHNHLLYMTGSWGIAGLLCLLLLLGIPLWKTARKLYRKEECPAEEKACFFLLLYGLLHGSIDLIMDVWPTGILALTAWGGLLYFQTGTPVQKERSSPGTKEKYMWIAAGVSGGTGLLFAVFLACHALYAPLRMLELKKGDLTRNQCLELIRETARKCPGDYPVNFSFMNLLERTYKDPVLSLEVSEIMLRGNIPNYPGVHMGRGNALMRLGRFQEAWDHYRQDALLFPLTLRPVYNMVQAARAMRNHTLAVQCEQILLERMRIRNLDRKDLYKILTGKSILDLRAGYKP